MPFAIGIGIGLTYRPGKGVGSGGGAPSTAGQPIGLLLALTKAS